MKEEKLYLMHIIEAAERIKSYLAAGREEFLKNQMVQDAVIKVLANLTESAGNIKDETKAAYPNIPWSAINAFRNVLVHNYSGDLELEETWNIIHNDLPPLLDVVKLILKEKYGN